MSVAEASIRCFVKTFARQPEYTAVAPGRVTVIGGHVDYNGGVVAAAALPRMTATSVGRNGKSILRIVSNCQPELVQLRLSELAVSHAPFWTRYLVGVLLEIGCADVGLDICVCSDLPMQRGLASSAALTVSTALAAVKISKQQFNLTQIPALCQRAESKYAGVNCGLIDQYVALHARQFEILCVDCLDQRHQATTIPPDLALVVCHSGINRELAKSHYNECRRQCQEVADLLGQRSLRTVTLDDLKPLRGQLPQETKRAEHVIREIPRVKEFWQAINRNDYQAVKAIMWAAHQSCRDLFACSHPVIDALVERAMAHSACVGARLTGGGWGGATINLVYESRVEDFCRTVCAWRSSIVVKRFGEP